MVDSTPFDLGGAGRRSAARRALVAGVSLSPNTYVVAVDRERKRLLVHQSIPSAKRIGGGNSMAAMNPWLIAATALMVGCPPCGLVCVRGSTMDRLVALDSAVC